LHQTRAHHHLLTCGSDILSHLTVTFVNMPFNKDRIMIKTLYVLKGYIAEVTEIILK